MYWLSKPREKRPQAPHSNGDRTRQRRVRLNRNDGRIQGQINHVILEDIDMRIAIGVMLGALVASTAAGQSASRFYPVQLQQDNRVTLTPSFSPDGDTLYFAQSDCSPIGACPQQLRKSVRTIDGWSTPTAVPLPRPGRVDWPNVTPDGSTLISRRYALCTTKPCLPSRATVRCTS